MQADFFYFISLLYLLMAVQLLQNIQHIVELDQGLRFMVLQMMIFTLIVLAVMEP